MHLVAIRRDRYQAHPWIARSLYAAFGGDPFRYGVRANRRTLEALLDYSAEQGLAATRLSLDEIFAPETLETCAEDAR